MPAHAEARPNEQPDERPYNERPEVQAFIAEMVQQHGFSANDLLNLFANTEFQPSVVKAMEPPDHPVVVRSWQRYRPRFINNIRIARGQKFMEQYADALKRARETYGVPEDDKDKLMQFVESPIINELVVTKLPNEKLSYRFEALAKSLNQGGKLINCQWDFDYENGNFSDPEYALRRKAIKGDGFDADLVAEKIFSKAGSYSIACKVQDSFGGETIKTMSIEVKE